MYASCDPIIRRELWKGSINIKEESIGPWIACGDVNAKRYPYEKTRRARNDSMIEFSKWNNEMEFIGPSLFGGSFTQ